MSKYDIVIIGSGPSSCFMAHYLLNFYSKYKICLITSKMKPFHCTYGLFEKQVKNSWLWKDPNYRSVFLKGLECDLHCPDNNKVDFDNNVNMKEEKYYLLDNNQIYGKLISFFEKKKLKIIEGWVSEIKENLDGTRTVLFNKNDSINCKLVIEGTGHLKPIGIKYLFKFPMVYQTFIGYKIRTTKPHNINKVILMDWYDTKINKDVPSSFCYFIPYSENVLFAEETILCHYGNDKRDSYIEVLEERLKKRLIDYKIEYDDIIFIEKDMISLSRFIPSSNSLSLGIGVNGNLVNPISGYSVGLNIYNIPKIAKLIEENNLDTKKIYQKYWNFFRKTIFLINTSGQKVLLSYKSNKEYSTFFKDFITKTNNKKIQFDTLFHNLYDNKFAFIISMYMYFFLKKRILFKILYQSFIVFIRYFRVLLFNYN